MTATDTRTAIPGYTAGTWTIDPVHSEVGFTVRHMMVSKVRGRFTSFSGEIVTGADPLGSSVTAEIALDSIVTGQEQRDAHIRSADFFDVENHPTMTYRSTGVRQDGDDYIVDGQLTLKGVTRDVPLALELNGFGPDAYGGTRAGFTATAEIIRSDFGISWNSAIEGGGVVVSDKVTIQLEIEAVLKA
jgi:polyisoprenoid-binding protein YceI